MLRSLGIAHHTVVSSAGPVPQISIDGRAIGGYDALAELHGRGELEALRGH
jgi:glutaredoxin